MAGKDMPGKVIENTLAALAKKFVEGGFTGAVKDLLTAGSAIAGGAAVTAGVASWPVLAVAAVASLAGRLALSAWDVSKGAKASANDERNWSILANDLSAKRDAIDRIETELYTQGFVADQEREVLAQGVNDLLKIVRGNAGGISAVEAILRENTKLIEALRDDVSKAHAKISRDTSRLPRIEELLISLAGGFEGTAMARIRKACGMTQASLASAADLSASTIGRIERGHSHPGLERAARLAKALDVSPGDLYASLPRTSQQAEVTGDHATVIQIVGEGNRVTIEGKPFLLLDTVERRVLRAKRRAGGGDLHLLRADSRTTKVIGRDDDIANFMAWLETDHKLSVRVIIGGAGAGKTRFALELMDRLAAAGRPQPWCTGFVDFSHLRTFDLTSSLTNQHWPQPTLLVVDYAAIESSLLTPWINYLSELLSDESRLRIILIDRNADIQRGWLRDMLTWTGDTTPGLADLFHPPEPITLRPLGVDYNCADRRWLLQSMLASINAERQAALPDLPEIGVDPDFDHAITAPQWADPLNLMMAAMVAAESNVVTALSLTRTDLAQKLANREIARITRAPGSEADKSLRVYLAACAAFARGLDTQRARAVAHLLQDQTGMAYTGGPAQLVRVVARLQFGTATTIGTVAPDIIAEAFVYLGLTHGEVPLDDTQRDAIILQLVTLIYPPPLKTLMFLIQDYATIWPNILDWLEHLVQHAHTEDFRLLLHIAEELPCNTLVLREKAVDIQTAVTDRLKTAPPPSDPDFRITHRLMIGRSLERLAKRLSDVGRRENALDAAQEAVEVYGNLAAEHPDAFMLDWAMALCELADNLRDVGRRDAALVVAQYAVEIHHRFPDRRADASMHNLAMALTLLAATFHDVNRHNDALDAAQEAVEIRRKLADHHPNALMHDRANALTTLANALGDAGRQADAPGPARQAVDLFRKLTTQSPDSFMPDLAMSLLNLSASLSHVGPYDEALDVAQEAVRLFRRLAAEHPDTFVPQLARSLVSLHLCHKAMDQMPDAKEAIVEAMERLAPHFLKLPRAFAGLMGTIGLHYLDCVTALGEKPDAKLFPPLAAGAKQLRQADDAAAAEERG